MTTSSRRPLASRNTRWARALASALVSRNVEPNHISAASVGFAGFGFFLFLVAAQTGPILSGLCLGLAAVTVQMRLLCNLLDGMVAIEGGRSSPTGAFWNEAPDRLADTLFLAGAGFAAQSPALGLLAATLAIGTAYLRELGRAEGFPPDFSGPMAKPHRMAALTVGSLIAAVYAPQEILAITLTAIALGTAITALRRALRMIANLNAR